MAKKTAAVAEQEETTKTSRSKGVTSGMRIYEYQNQSLERNVKAKLTDQQIADDWSREFPEAMNFSERPEMVQTVRGLYNKGKHKNDVPDVALVAYDENKKPLPAPTRGRKKAEASDDDAPAPAKKTVAKPAAAPTKLKLKKTA